MDAYLMALTKPAGCFLQGFGSILLFGGLLYLISGSILAGAGFMLAGFGLLYWGGVSAIR